MVSMPDSPSLAAAGLRFRRDWVERFLLRPYDLRPGLRATMPRLNLTPDQARDIAAFLIPDAPSPPPPISSAQVEPGRELFLRNKCSNCHAFSGAWPDGHAPTVGQPSVANLRAADPSARGPILAPDLRNARDRARPDRVLVWLRDPQEVKPGTVMPTFLLSENEVRQLASFVLLAPLAPRAVAPSPMHLPLLKRRVSFAEVQKRVLLDTCWHCHGEPDYDIGDGGPGNTGGLGFKGRGLNLLDYSGVVGGYIADSGKRRSLFAPWRNGATDSRLVASLRARQVEMAGGTVEGIRGMPLGLPALSAEDIQLVESWVAQGHQPR